eukprot:Skav232206  [mRNA]  locus=scaffold2626:139467:140769:+ [translate_table: standard]
MRGLTWILRFSALYAADVKLSIGTTSTDTKLMVDGKDTGCTAKTTSQDLTCKSQDADPSVGKSVPARYFSAEINCKNMDTAVYDSLMVKPLSQCAKMTFTQHMEKGGHVNLETLEMVPNSVANFTCVVFPLDSFGTRINHEGWSKLPVNVIITGIKNGEEKVSTWTMGSVRFHVQGSTGGKTFSWVDCRMVVKENFDWGLSLLKSSHNVHEVLWTSQAKKPNIDHIASEINMYDFKVTKTTKNVDFEDLWPMIDSAFVSTTDRNFKEHVKLKKLEAPTGLVVLAGAFLYRRHRRIQAAREGVDGTTEAVKKSASTVATLRSVIGMPFIQS